MTWKHARIGLAVASVAALLGPAACDAQSGTASRKHRIEKIGVNPEASRPAAANATGGAERMLLRLIHDQDLTPTEELQLVSVRTGLVAKWRTLHQELAPIEAALRVELARPAPDPATVHTLMDKGLALHATLAHAVTDEVLAVIGQLDADQRQLIVLRARRDEIGAPTREDVTAIEKALTNARTSGVSATSSAVMTPIRWKPSELALHAFDGAALSESQNRLRKEVRRELHAGEAAVDAAVNAETDAVLIELSKPVLDTRTIHAGVDRVLAVYAKAAHATAARAVSVSVALDHEQKLGSRADAFPLTPSDSRIR